MSESIFSYVPHLLLLGAQTGNGIMLMALSTPPVVGLLKAATASRSPTYHDLVSAYPAVWQVMFELSLSGLVILGLIGLAVGMVFAECFYRLAILVRYHEEFHLEPPDANCGTGAAVTEFNRRCRILKDSALHRVYEWENLQSSFVYYVEANFWSLAIVLLASGLIVECSGGAARDAWFVVAVAVLVAAILLAALMRHARIEKYKAFQSAYVAIKQILGD